MRIARLETTDGTRHAIWTGEAWAVVEDGFADPPIRHRSDRLRPTTPGCWRRASPGCRSASPHDPTNNDPHAHQAVVGRLVIREDQAEQCRHDRVADRPRHERNHGGDRLRLRDRATRWSNDVTNVDRERPGREDLRGQGRPTAIPRWAPGSRPNSTIPSSAAITVTVSGVVKAECGTFNQPSTVAESIVYVA